MAIQVGTSGARAERMRAAAKSKDRNRKIVLGVLMALFVIILAVELPSTLSKLSGSGGGTATPAQPTATAGAQTATLVQPDLAPALNQLARFGAKDPFLPQLTPSGSTTNPTASASPPSGPPVRATNFVAKDPFEAQISTPSATPVSTPAKTTANALPTVAPTPTASAAGGYVVVLNSVPAAHGQKLASLAVIAAENAGLVDVKSSTLPTSGSALDIYTGPYQSQSVAQQELIRALRDGYTQATVSNLPHSHHSTQ